MDFSVAPDYVWNRFFSHTLSDELVVQVWLLTKQQLRRGLQWLTTFERKQKY